MDLYFSPRCGHSKRVLFAVHELGIDVRPHVLDLRRDEHRTPAYLALNPLGKVPTLVDGDHVLWESSAIVLYLAEQRPERGLVPRSASERADLHKWLFFLAYEIGSHAWLYVSDPAARDASGEQLRRALAVVETQLADRDHLLGEFTLADVAFAPQLALLRAHRFELSPRVDAWAARIHARPAWQAITRAAA